MCRGSSFIHIYLDKKKRDIKVKRKMWAPTMTASGYTPGPDDKIHNSKNRKIALAYLLKQQKKFVHAP